MKTYEDIVTRILEVIDRAVHAPSEEGEKYGLATAKELGWVIGIEPSEIAEIYKGEYTKEFVLKRGKENGILD